MAKYFNENATYQEVKQFVVDKSANYLTDQNKELVRLGLCSLDNLPDKQRIVSYVRNVDNTCDDASKIFIILLGLSMMTINEEYTNKLSDDSLTLFCISYPSEDISVTNINFMINIMPSEILNTICEKTDDISDRATYCSLFEYRHSESEKMTKEEKITSICDKIKNTSKEEFEQLKKQYFNKLYSTTMKSI